MESLQSQSTQAQTPSYTTEEEQEIKNQIESINQYGIKNEFLSSFEHLLQGNPEMVSRQFEGFSPQTKNIIASVKIKGDFLPATVCPFEYADFKKIKSPVPAKKNIYNFPYLYGFREGIDGKFQFNKDFKKFSDILLCLFEPYIPKVKIEEYYPLYEKFQSTNDFDLFLCKYFHNNPTSIHLTDSKNDGNLNFIQANKDQYPLFQKTIVDRFLKHDFTSFFTSNIGASLPEEYLNKLNKKNLFGYLELGNKHIKDVVNMDKIISYFNNIKHVFNPNLFKHISSFNPNAMFIKREQDLATFASLLPEKDAQNFLNHILPVTDHNKGITPLLKEIVEQNVHAGTTDSRILKIFNEKQHELKHIDSLFDISQYQDIPYSLNVTTACINYAKNYRDIENRKLFSQINGSHSQPVLEHNENTLIQQCVDQVDLDLKQIRENAFERLFHGVDEILQEKGDDAAFEQKLQTLMQDSSLSIFPNKKNFEHAARTYYQSKRIN